MARYYDGGYLFSPGNLLRILRQIEFPNLKFPQKKSAQNLPRIFPVLPEPPSPYRTHARHLKIHCRGQSGRFQLDRISLGLADQTCAILLLFRLTLY
jgi:hypothetical protein